MSSCTIKVYEVSPLAWLYQEGHQFPNSISAVSDASKASRTKSWTSQSSAKVRRKTT